MSVQKVSGWQTSDGKIFDRKEAADRHEEKLDLVKYLNDNPIYCGGGKSAFAKEVLYWMENNPRIHLILLPPTKDEVINGN